MNWECPYCGNHTTLIEEKTIQSNYLKFNVPSGDLNEGEEYKLTSSAISCPNVKCKKLALSLNLEIGKFTYPQFGGPRFTKRLVIQKWKLIPQSIFKVFPDYIPQALINDYQEACKICELSPKASATLARRCLQGMLKDFWQTKKKDLFDQIEEIKDKVDSEIWDAIDGLRKLGNIGAHMRGDINLIVDIDDEEADQLIWLIETLFKEWYVARFERQERLKGIQKLSAEKYKK